MNKIIKEDILTIFGKLIKVLETKDIDTVEIKKLSNHTIHNASIFQDEDSISTAIFVYALSKVIERDRDKRDYDGVTMNLERVKYFLEHDNVASYRKGMKKLFRIIESIDNKLRFYIREVISKAQLKKGERIYAQGISAARTAEILGISRWDLIDYLGKTNLPDRYPEEFSIRSRLKYARSLFK